jgi:hypothetical protein
VICEVLARSVHIATHEEQRRRQVEAYDAGQLEGRALRSRAARSQPHDMACGGRATGIHGRTILP